MNPVPQFIPAVTLQAQLPGLRALGLDVADLQQRLQLDALSPESPIPVQAYLDMWTWATQAWGRPGLPTALAGVIPFGSFGVIDYLVASADTVRGCLTSLQQHLSMVSDDMRLELHSPGDGLHWVEARALGAIPDVVEEFLVALLVQRLAAITQGLVQPEFVSLRAKAPGRGHDERAERLRVPVRYGAAASALALSESAWNARVPRADPTLHATLQRVVAQLRPAAPAANELVLAMRARLRELLATGSATPAYMAGLLGLSERTLQRRLADQGRSFAQVVEEFRRDEARRLLSDPRQPIAEIAARLGFAEQTSFTRAFRRWEGTTPAVWRRSKASVASRPDA